MSEATAVRKITVSLPRDLVAFADREAERLNTSRSRIIAQALAEIQAEKEDRLAECGQLLSACHHPAIRRCFRPAAASWRDGGARHRAAERG